MSELGLELWSPMSFILFVVQELEMREGCIIGEGCIVGVCSCPRKGNRNVVTEVLASFPIP